MRQDLAVNFETFYYFSLLEKIRETAQKTYSGSQLKSLEEFLDYLIEPQDAMSSIEKLTRFRGSSDLSIFFSDILEHLHRIQPAKAMQEIPNYTDDFLEMYRFLSEEEEWQNYLHKVIQAKVPPQAGEFTPEEMSFEEYCRHVIQSKIEFHARNLTDDQQRLYLDFLESLFQKPALADELRQKISNPKVRAFAEVSSQLLNGSRRKEDLDRYISNFENEVERWATLFMEILQQNASELEEILQAQAAEEDGLEASITERSFDQVEPETVFEEEGSSEAADDLDHLLDRAQKQQQKYDSAAFSEEEIERRMLLQDYIIDEVLSCQEETRTLLTRLSGDNHDIQAENTLLENLKLFKDLGQIHSYQGIELVGKNLLKMFESIFRNEQEISEPMLQSVDGIFEALPEYVRSSVGGENQARLSRIEERLSEFRSAIGAEDQISLAHEETLKETFQEIISRKLEVVKKKLIDKTIPDWDENDQAELSSTLDNIIFWSNILKWNNVVVGVNLLRRLLLSSHRYSLGTAEIDTIRAFIKLMTKKYSGADEELWSSATADLQRILASREAVSVSEALPALEEVTIAHIRRILSQINSQQTSVSELFRKTLPHFFSQLRLNSILVGNEDLENSSDEILQALGQLTTEALSIEESELPRLERVLEGMLKNLRDASHPIDLSDFSAYLANLSGEASGIHAADDTEAVSDAEIESVFRQEALKYVDEIEENVARLAEEDEDQLWKDTGVTLHTLKGSSQMTGKSEVAKLAVLLERIFEGVSQGQVPRQPETFLIIRNLIESIRETIRDPSNFRPELVQQIQDDLDRAGGGEFGAQSTPDADEEIAEEREFLTGGEFEEIRESQEVIELLEQDPEMLEIFNDEVSSNIKVVERNLDDMEKFAYDKILMQEVDRLVHDINSAAKMLGLAEISGISERMEKMVDLIYQQKITDLRSTIPLMRRAMLVIRELTQKRKIEQQFYEEVLGQLDEVVEGRRQSPRGEPREATAPESQPEGLTPQVWEAFYQEALELTDDLNYLILELEKSNENEELRHHLMRSLHTLKGSSAMVNAVKIESLAHLSEEVLEKFSKQQLPLHPEIFDLLFGVMDEIRFILNSLQTFQQEETQHYDDLIKKLREYAEEDAAGPTADKTTSSVAQTAPEQDAFPEPVETKEPQRVRSEKAAPAEQTYIRLNIDQMNHLLNLAAELVISHNQFKNQIDRLKDIKPAISSELKLFEETRDHLNSILRLERKIEETLSPLSEVQPGLKESVRDQLVNIEKILNRFEAFQVEIDSFATSLKDNSSTYEENLQKLNKLSNELLDEIIQARLVPIHLLFKRFHRPIRDMARQSDKKVNLVIRGEDTELDRSLVEELYNPLIHIIRNAIDHGIETPEEREKAGKNPEGTLEIRASRDRNQVTIEISDDGKGIDIEKVKQLALEKGVISKSDIEKLSEQDSYELIFYPGFSTLPEATRVSGRGVGLDAVKTEIERYKGDIRVYSEQGKGTTFVIRVPISLSVIQSMLIEVGEHIYSIPLNQVEETTKVEKGDLIQKGEQYFLNYKGKQIPLIFLSRLLVLSDQPQTKVAMQEKSPVIIAFDRGNHVALLVDKIIRREEILIKSLGPSLKRLKYVIGGSIMADGRVVLVLDIPQIIQDTLKMSPAPLQTQTGDIPRVKRQPGKTSRRQKKEAQKVIADREPTILVVDDSLSIRKYLSGLLSQRGYAVTTAKNGHEALNLIWKNSYDLIITDLEMPQVSGYDLIEAVRLEDRFKEVPIIVLTGRAGENFKNLTTQLGADAYIIKPFKDQELFDAIKKFIQSN